MLNNCKLINRNKPAKKKHFRLPMKNQTKKALLIGINYRGTQSQLNGCINDANRMKTYLVDVCKFSENDIIMLSDHIAAKPSELPTRSNILKSIKWLTSGLPDRGDCQLVVHYSGHGSHTRDRSGDESDGQDETICPLDYAASGDITDDDLKSLLVDVLPANAKLFCLFDCCHSGTGLDLRYNCKVFGTKHNRDFRLVQDKDNGHSAAEVISFSGCRDDQYSADAYIKGKYQGAMTWAFFNVLEKNQYEPITYKRLIGEIQGLMVDNGYDQVPQMSSGQFIDLKNTFCLTD